MGESKFFRKMKILPLLLGATLALSSREEARQKRRDEIRNDRDLNAEDAKQFLKWREEKYQRERAEERSDRRYEYEEDKREYQRGPAKYEEERREDRYERLEDDREYE